MKKGGPSEKKRRHKPMAEFQDVIDLESMLRGVRRLAEELINQGERQINHTA